MSSNQKIIRLILPIIILVIGNLYSQNSIDLTQLESAIKLKNWDLSDSIVLTINPSNLNPKQLADFNFLTGKLKFNKGLYEDAFKDLKAAREFFITHKALYKQGATEVIIIDCIGYLNDKKIKNNTLINSVCKISNKTKNYELLCDCQYFKGTIALKNNRINDAVKHYKNISTLALNEKDSAKYYNNQLNIGVLIGFDNKKANEVISIIKETLPYFEKTNDIQRQFFTRYNLALQYKNIKKYNSAITSLLSADSLSLSTDIFANKQVLYLLLSETYEDIKEYKLSLTYLKKSNANKDSLHLQEQKNVISDLQAKYQSKEKDKEISQKKRQNRNLVIAFFTLILLGGIIIFLLQKNYRKKQKLTQQEKEIESQKLSTLLKEQELMAIDAMIAGQEKERQRIANDLHDDLGGLMANVKLHFDALSSKKTPDLHKKTSLLIEEAYQKIRSIAHAKHSGVIAKQGLLKAVKHMAEKVSNSNKIKINVVAHGLENRLENSLELTLFRIIQELITNVLKHAKATEANIHITNHDQSINIMVEDNGIGFNPNQITTSKQGMGISSIDKRIEHLEGQLTIESQHQKGSTIIIDIPLKSLTYPA